MLSFHIFAYKTHGVQVDRMVLINLVEIETTERNDQITGVQSHQEVFAPSHEVE